MPNPEVLAIRVTSEGGRQAPARFRSAQVFAELVRLAEVPANLVRDYDLSTGCGEPD